MQNHRQRMIISLSQETASSLEGGTIGELARRTGLTTKAIRYYESIGVLPPSLHGTPSSRKMPISSRDRKHVHLVA